MCFGGIQYLVTRAVELQSFKYSKHKSIISTYALPGFCLVVFCFGGVTEFEIL